MKFNRHSRRMFLQGSGGLLVALPMLESLVPKALANGSTPNDRCILLVWSPHGGGRHEYMLPTPLRAPLGPYPSLTQAAFLSESTAAGDLAPAHMMRYGELSSLLENDPITNNQQFSHVIGPKLSAHAQKMSVLRGLDIPTVTHGHTNGLWGNWKASFNSFDSYEPSMADLATIDQVLANSSSFYSAAQLVNQVREKAVITSGGKSYDALGNSVSTTSSRIQGVFDAIFGTENIASTDPRKLIIDQVLADYQRLLSPGSPLGSRISTEDRAILENFGDQLHETERRLNTVVSCTPERPSENTHLSSPSSNGKTVTYANWDEMYDVLADVITLAFTCGSTRLFSTGFSINVGGHNDYHQSIAHNLGTVSQAEIHANNLRYLGEEFIAGVATRLDAVPIGGGKTALDRSALLWGQEHSIEATHWTFDIPMVVVGSLDGNLAQNRFLDYRNLDNLSVRRSGWTNARSGVMMNQFLANILQAAGMNRSEFERAYPATGAGVVPGYGDTLYARGQGFGQHDLNGHTSYPPLMLAQLSDPLPFFGQF